jgi:hypothetical protein
VLCEGVPGPGAVGSSPAGVREAADQRGMYRRGGGSAYQACFFLASLGSRLSVFATYLVIRTRGMHEASRLDYAGV